MDPTSIQAHHDFSTLKLALTYQPTGEKVLCTLQCLQLGKTPVQYAPPCRSATTAAIATTPVRFMWYKDQLQTGHNGFYADPKEDDHRTPSQLYAVQWLAKKNLDDLQTLRRLHPTIVGIARAGHRYGARTNTADAEALHQTLFPHDIFVGE